ncbi:hypothetical protein [Pandoraea communis]|uniref:hypothetical protein n=1 Tax=Pandoraea communis TaxID=2508297 RepID=UPI0025A5168C|nr:hypothetical protein [Pandoraea communis]MDM8358462.1 hypothetical protein [Pandoraea communis]
MKTSDTGDVVHARQPSGNEPRRLTTLVLSVVVFGPETITGFLHSVQSAQAAASAGQAHLLRISSVFIMAHAPLWLAWALLSAASLMSPYVHDYDVAWFGILIAWLCAHGKAHGRRTGEREWPVLLWLTPLAGVMVVSFVGFPFMPFITIATLAGVQRRLRLDSSPGSASAMAPLANGGDGGNMYAVSP